jgi:hypothetical protein
MFIDVHITGFHVVARYIPSFHGLMGSETSELGVASRVEAPALWQLRVHL